jgi:DNA-directed RNA polymerase I subunit RPA2
MYSGITGETFRADIYIGVVYYQRLRHMVSDKFQVRTTGPVHALTHQPVKGRKRAGGIRLGEMERDSILAHGAAFLLQDRLMNCSDYSKAHVCFSCGSMLSPVATVVVGGEAKEVTCRNCEIPKVNTVAIPFVLRYLAAELMAMNIDLKMHF